MILDLVKLKININYHTWVLPSKVSCLFLRANTAMHGLTHTSLCPQLLPHDCGTLHELYPHHPGQGHAPGGGGQSRDLYRCGSVPLGGDQRYSSWVGRGAAREDGWRVPLGVKAAEQMGVGIQALLGDMGKVTQLLCALVYSRMKQT